MFDTIVDVRAIAEQRADPRLILVDCRHGLTDFGAGRRAYEEAHIPGAFLADTETDLAGEKTGKNGRHPLPDRDAFVAFLRRNGVNDDTQLVAYDAGADMFAARFWFLMRWIGHEAVAVLDGGFAAWTSAEYPVRADVPTHAPGTITAREPLDGLLDAAAVEAGAGVLLDARASERFRGEVEPIDPVAGHIPGARNRWFKENYDERGFWKSPERLVEELREHGSAEDIVHYCGSGVSAAVNLLAYKIAGLPGSRAYAGGWSEWCVGGHPSLKPER
ncbi:MAG: sulfurtransferase [Candidatus Eremiobacteraeota bacterium]|nr:sulfurtransferase [Candidatus Eremiobacteraeota bacterium]